MCLITKDINPRIAAEDITCYKVLLAYLISPYQRFVYELNKLYEIDEAPPIISNDLGHMLGANLFHTFINLGDAKDEADYWYRSNQLFSYERLRTVYVAECVIPKDSSYYTGEFDGEEMDCYGSNKLIIKNVTEYVPICRLS